ncbi:MAG: 2-carboxy-1,4-naphthoquinone phytyltransferase [Oscillatoriales cyanobacterium SM2_1_8]|nr:2-carboxy-1,4-naphthoquinone phytyltransferase [Oscillatoriales cyanobacterium SM2_1_8]
MVPGTATLPQGQLWKAAIKWPMYSVAVMPMVVGTAIARSQGFPFQPWRLAGLLAAAVLVLAWENLCNDVFDAETGIDVRKPHSVVNLTGRKTAVWGMAQLCLLLGLGIVAALAWGQQDPTILVLLAVACGLGYLYQGPPFRWGYAGWGEPLCFLCFGPIGVGLAYYSQAQSWSWTIAPAAVSVGLAVTLVLFCSHFHQIEDDRAAGKRSPAVKLGLEGALAWVNPWCALIYGAVAAGMVGGWVPWPAGLMGIGAWWWRRLAQFLDRHRAEPAALAPSKFLAIAQQFWSGVGLAVGYWLSLP